ncbi:MAG TPA: polysaccharide deacetylase family protein [Candidatus Paceibacterota bacterium]|nr:polysaccharide deacetylase family protein [Candidatus Paceibacterota bacterium]
MDKIFKYLLVILGVLLVGAIALYGVYKRQFGTMHKFLKYLLIMLGVLLVVVVALYGVYKLMNSRTYQLFGTIVPRVNTQEKVVALTFDDAPTQYTGDVLNTLADENIHATFYLIGQRIEEYPDVAKAIADQGDELGNHSYSHQRMLLKSQSFIDTEIQTTNKLIRDTGYTGEITFRPPNSKKLVGLPWYLWRHGIITIEADVEPDTYYQGDVDKMISYTLANTKPGSIIVMHPFCDGVCASDREALPQIIDGLKAEGYTFVTISELLQKGGIQ